MLYEEERIILCDRLRWWVYKNIFYILDNIIHGYYPVLDKNKTLIDIIEESNGA